MCWVRSVSAEWPTYDYLNTNHMGTQYLSVTLVAACGYPPWIFFRVNLVGSPAKQPLLRLFLCTYEVYYLAFRCRSPSRVSTAISPAPKNDAMASHMAIMPNVQ